MTRERHTKLNAQISEEAAEWFVEIRSGDIDAAGREQFDAWVRSSPEHLRAYIEIAAIWNERDTLRARRGADPTLDLTPNAPDNVIDLPGATASDAPQSAPSARDNPRPRRFLVAACVAGLVVVIGSAAWFQSSRARTYATDVGEQRLVRLTDGSTVELNSRSLVRVRFSADERRVELLDGQALFHVAKDRARPFIVRSDVLQVRAVGTQFDVNRKRSGTIVTVLEGRVAVTGAFAPRRVAQAETGTTSFALTAGEQVTLTPRVAPRPVRTNVSAVTAWTQHQLVLESAPLTEVAEEFNRYSLRTLVAADHGSEPLLLSGVFSTDPEFLIRYLRGRPDITIRETDSQIQITRQD
jgi:transmembrane sensor